MIELEKTYLAKKLPNALKSCEFKEIIDVYLPKTSVHPKIRLRKNGNEFELTKKEPVNDGDASHQNEQTIVLTETEFNDFNRQLEGKRVRKIRYLYDHNGRIAEFDVFQDELTGLVVVDFEFATLDEKENFQMPDFCLCDITQEDFVAGGMICGKSYADIEDNLKKFGYVKLFLE
jgi:CYTH domain-containing protein